MPHAGKDRPQRRRGEPVFRSRLQRRDGPFDPSLFGSDFAATPITFGSDTGAVGISTGNRYARQGSALLVGHTRRETAVDIRRLASMVAEKPSQREKGLAVLYESDGEKDSLDKIGEFKGITYTAESYDEHEASEFRVILDDAEDDDGPDAEDDARDEAIKPPSERNSAATPIRTPLG